MYLKCFCCHGGIKRMFIFPQKRPFFDTIKLSSILAFCLRNYGYCFYRFQQRNCILMNAAVFLRFRPEQSKKTHYNDDLTFCYWLLLAPKESRIKLKFLLIKLYGNKSNCTDVYLLVRTYPEYTRPAKLMRSSV